MDFDYNKLYRKKYIGDTVKSCKQYQEFIVNVFRGEFQYIKDNYKFVTHANVQNECFIIATAYSKDVEFVKYIYECFDRSIDTSSKNPDGHSCLTIACRKGHIDVIKYLVNDLNLNVNNAFTVFKDSCLMQACSKNNLEVVKYLIEVCDADFNYKKINGFDCVSYIHPKNKHSGEIAAYLLEHTDTKKPIGHIDVLKTCIPLMKNAEKINWQLFNALKFFKGTNLVIPIIKNVNPLILDSFICYEAGVTDPYSEKFSKFKQYVDQLIEPFERNSIVNDQLCKNISFIPLMNDDTNIIDFSERDEFLFIHNKIEYYGKKNIVYDCIDFFKDTKDIIMDYDNIVLGEGIVVPKYIINKYILSCYIGCFYLNTVDQSDIIETLKFIDRYPTKYVSIDKLENDIVRYYDKLNISYNLYIKDISERYQLKILYLDIKCKELAQQMNINKQ